MGLCRRAPCPDGCSALRCLLRWRAEGEFAVGAAARRTTTSDLGKSCTGRVNPIDPAHRKRNPAARLTPNPWHLHQAAALYLLGGARRGAVAIAGQSVALDDAVFAALEVAG